MTSDQWPSDSTKKLTERLDINFALQAAGLGIWEIDPETKQVLWDERCQALMGLHGQDYLPFEEAVKYIHPDDLDHILDAVQWAMTAESGGLYDQTYRILSADGGALRWVHFWGQSHFTPAGELYRFAGVAQEVTQQVEANHRLEANEQILRDMVLKAPIGISILNAPDLVIEIVNPSFVEVAGKPYQDLIGKHYWVPFAEAAPYYADALDRVAREGEAFSVNEVELMMIRYGQQEIIYVTFFYMPIKDAVGTVRKVAVWVLENTHQVVERKKIELLVQQRTEELSASNKDLLSINESFAAANQALERANTDLIRSNQNLEQFAYIASHDLQEPLRKIQQFGDLLKNRFTKPEGEELIYLERMQTAASRMSILIKDLLVFSRISTSQVLDRAVPLNEVISQALDTLSMVIEESKAQIDVDELPIVQGDRLQLNQLFQNLLSNALKFRRTSPSGDLVKPQIKIRVSRLLRSELPVMVVPTRYAENYYLIEVIDNGIGFEEKYLDRIFQVFQRLHGKNEFAGSGVGLAIVQKVVTNHGGAVTATSGLNQGATFGVYLPN